MNSKVLSTEHIILIIYLFKAVCYFHWFFALFIKLVTHLKNLKIHQPLEDPVKCGYPIHPLLFYFFFSYLPRIPFTWAGWDGRWLTAAFLARAGCFPVKRTLWMDRAEYIQDYRCRRFVFAGTSRPVKVLGRLALFLTSRKIIWHYCNCWKKIAYFGVVYRFWFFEGRNIFKLII